MMPPCINSLFSLILQQCERKQLMNNNLVLPQDITMMKFYLIAVDNNGGRKLINISKALHRLVSVKTIIKISIHALFWDKLKNLELL